jgi:hypothetical protein
MKAGPAPPWHQFRVLKHPPEHAHLDALYCLAAAACWLNGLNAYAGSVNHVLARMRSALPPKLPRGGIREKHIRQAADLYGLAIYRCGQRAGWNDLVDRAIPADTVMIASVGQLPVPGMQEPPEGYRFVVVLGIPDKQRRFLIADPHPDARDKYKVPVDELEIAWERTATETANAKALVVWKPDR